MNPNHLRSFVSIANHGSFSKAAKAMHISTQALQQQIKLLEKTVGVLLLYRNHQGVSMTPAGEYLYDGAKHLLSYSELLIKGCRDTLSMDSEFRIGTSHEITSTFTYQISYEYKAAFPQTDLSIVYTDSRNKFSELMDLKFDICESFNNDIIAKYGLEYFPILEAPLYCIVSKNHPFSKKENVCPADIEGQTLLTSITHTDCFGNEQFEPYIDGIVYKRYHTPASKKLETALGNGFYFDYLLEPLDTDDFVAIPYKTVDYHTFGFVYMPNPSPAVTRFMEIAKNTKLLTKNLKNSF